MRPGQDVLNLGNEARMNVPGRADRNWRCAGDDMLSERTFMAAGPDKDLGSLTRRILTMSHDITDIESTAKALVADGKGILAADETVATLTKRFDTLGIPSTKQSRRTYREMLFTSTGDAEFISGVILHDETIRQKSSSRHTAPAPPLEPGHRSRYQGRCRCKTSRRLPEQTITEGLDGLRERLAEYPASGARFAKWRAVIRIADALPSRACISGNAHAARALCRALSGSSSFVPIVEPEVLMDGSHDIERCEEVTGVVLHHVFHALFDQRVALEGHAAQAQHGHRGHRSPHVASGRVADRHGPLPAEDVPAAVPGIVFLSGGQSDQATTHLNAINRLPGPRPWKISFSYGRALQASAMQGWRGGTGPWELASRP